MALAKTGNGLLFLLLRGASSSASGMLRGEVGRGRTMLSPKDAGEAGKSVSTVSDSKG